MGNCLNQTQQNRPSGHSVDGTGLDTTDLSSGTTAGDNSYHKIDMNNKNREHPFTRNYVNPSNSANKLRNKTDKNSPCYSGIGTQTSQAIYLTKNQAAIGDTKFEVTVLLRKISSFEGVNESDNNYRYLDEMLTRCILNLDNVECDSMDDRKCRKETINGVNQAISVLERKMVFNSELKSLKEKLSISDD